MAFQLRHVLCGVRCLSSLQTGAPDVGGRFGLVAATEAQTRRNQLANTLFEPDVRDVFTISGFVPIHRTVLEWRGPHDQTFILSLRLIRAENDLVSAAPVVENTPRQTGEPTTAIGSAIIFASRELAKQRD